MIPTSLSRWMMILTVFILSIPFFFFFLSPSVSSFSLSLTDSLCEVDLFLFVFHFNFFRKNPSSTFGTYILPLVTAHIRHPLLS